jgi:hypothetical protein
MKAKPWLWRLAEMKVEGETGLGGENDGMTQQWGAAMVHHM